jgi:hypothetical protein
MVRAFETVSGRNIPYDVRSRRPGDIDACYTATDYASKLMNWPGPSRPRRSLALAAVQPERLLIPPNFANGSSATGHRVSA